MIFKTGIRVIHPVYGKGTVVNVSDEKALGDSSHGWPEVRVGDHIWANGASRYKGRLNVAVKFDGGGPMGFAENSSNDVKDLTSEIA